MQLGDYRESDETQVFSPEKMQMHKCKHTHAYVQTQTLLAYFRGVRKSLCSSTPLWALMKTPSFLIPGPLQLYFLPQRSPNLSRLTPWVWFLLEDQNFIKAFPDHLISSHPQSTPIHPYITYHLCCLFFLQVVLTI